MVQNQISPKNQTEQADSTYNNLVNRVKVALEDVEKKTWEGIQYDIEQAIELESAAEEMTREEVALLGTYLKRDLKNLTHYIEETGKGVADWLKFDTELLESRLLDLMLSVADKTALEQIEFEKSLNSVADAYKAGEYIMPGTFECTACGDIYVFSEPQTLVACIECANEDFKRVTTEEENKS